MSRRASSIQIAAWLISGLVAAICPSCGTPSRPDPERHLTNPTAARRALEESLETWRSFPDRDRTTPTIRPVMFSDQSRKPGQRLKEFTILGQAAGVDGCRKFQVKLTLEQPDESVLAAYYVFGEGPIWVYRAEDFEMMMRMDPMARSVDPSELEDGAKAESEHPKHTPPAAAAELKTGSRSSP